MQRLTLVINPNAGTRQGRRFLAEIIACFTDAGYLVTVYVTGKRGDAEAFVREHGGETDLIVASGGDGTLNEVIAGLLRGRHETPLGYIPCGSTNDFANGLGLPLNTMEACQHIVEAKPRPLDIGFFGKERYFSYTASFGAFTQVSWSTPQNVKNVLGHIAYILEGIRSLSDIHPIRMNITADGKEYEDDYIFGAVCNSTSLGGVLKLKDSEVHMSDGLFEALLIPFPEDILALNRILTCLGGGQYDDPVLLFLRADHFTFRCKTKIKWTLDGEEADAGSELLVQNIPHAITLKG